MEYHEAVYALNHELETKYNGLHRHCLRVARYSLMIAQALAVDEIQQRSLYDGAIIHDIGKIMIPENILNKPGKLSETEFRLVKKHTTAGYIIAKKTGVLESLLPSILYHHERIDGKGYPAGLCDAEIPLNAKIIAIADSFDAMTCNRPYRKAMPLDAAISELIANSGSQFDSNLVEMFLNSPNFGILDEQLGSVANEA